MLKQNLLLISLVVGLAACSSAAAGSPAPVEVEAARPVEVETGSMADKPAAQEPVAEVEEPAVEEAMAEEAAAKVEEEPAEAAMVEESAAKIEELAAEEAMAEESMTKAEEPAAEETMAEEGMAEVEEPTTEVTESGAMAEASPVEAETMKQETMTAVGPTPAQLQLLAGLENQGMPPELRNQVWLNSDPLKLADLHGKVVIVEFWTFGCYNCKNVVPSLRAWHHTYKDEGLVIIGVHTPEFGYERELENVKQALIDQDIPYAVAIDNDWQTWRAYHNRYWPAKYFIDKAGNLRHIHIGEGRYEQQEEIIQALLAEKV
ncbi:MAG: redoxin domain-containing protein [Anaerolineae bacterium]|nr:redoxin domain-containing protein [Anaerolineae bacterium]